MSRDLVDAETLRRVSELLAKRDRLRAELDEAEYELASATPPGFGERSCSGSPVIGYLSWPESDTDVVRYGIQTATVAAPRGCCSMHDGDYATRVEADAAATWQNTHERLVWPSADDPDETG